MSRTIIEVPMKTHNVDLVLSIIDKIKHCETENKN